MKDEATPICPRCGGSAVVTDGKFGKKSECCGLWSWGYKPLTDRETHRARIKAHEAFDALWRDGGISRAEAYRWLATAMNIPARECHISMMNKKDALRVAGLKKDI